MTPTVARFHRIVVKIGSSLLVEDSGIRHQWLDALAADLATVAANGQELLIVSSGAIALGRRILGLPRGTLML